MLYVALTLAAALVLTAAASGSLTRTLVRAHARERDLLLNQLLHAAGKTWTPPPAGRGDGPQPPSRAEILAGYTVSPGPDDEA